MWFYYPQDPTTFPIDLQFFFGDSILVSPVTDENSTSVTLYLPKDIFYDFYTMAPVQGEGATLTLDDIGYTQIPLHIRGGAVLPLRRNSTMTTTELRDQDFQFVVAPNGSGEASGSLYIDDGESIAPRSATQVGMSYKKGRLVVSGRFGYGTDVKTGSVRFLGVGSAPKAVSVKGKSVKQGGWVYNATSKVLDVQIGLPLTGPFDVEYK